MCIFKIETGKTAGNPAIAPGIKQDTGLPESKATIAPEEVASVQYGKKKTPADEATSNRTGTDALRIDLGNDGSAKTSGVNTTITT